MEKLLKISEFAVLSGISRQLLIYYDNQGILHPAQVDRANGYRYLQMLSHLLLSIPVL